MRRKGSCWTGIVFTRQKEEETAKHCLNFKAFFKKEVSTFSSPFFEISNDSAFRSHLSFRTVFIKLPNEPFAPTSSVPRAVEG